MSRLAAVKRFCTDPKTLASGALFLCLLAVGLMTAELGPSLNLLAEQTNTTLDKVSFLYTGRSVGYFVGSLFSGYLFDIVNREGFILGTSVIVNGLCNCAIPFSKNLIFLIALCVLQGISAGALDAGGSVCILRLHGKKVDPWMQAMHFFFAAGTTISPFVVGIFIDKTGNLKMSYLVMGIATCVIGIFMFFTPPFKSEQDIIQLAKKHKIVRKRYEKELAKRKEKELAKVGDSIEEPKEPEVIISGENEHENEEATIEIPLDENEAKSDENSNDPRELISSKKYWFIVFFCGTFLAFYASVEATYGSYVASYSKLKKFEDEVSASYLTSVFWGSFCVGRLVSIPIAVWIPPEGFLVGSLVLTVISVLPLVIFPKKITAWIVSVIFGLFIGPIWATLWNIMGKYLVVTGVAGTVLAASSCVGELSFTIEVGQLIVKVGPSVFSIQQVVSSSVELLMCIFIVAFFRRLHAKRAKMNSENKEGEALTHDDEMMEARENNTKEEEEEGDSDKDKMNEIKLEEIHS